MSIIASDIIKRGVSFIYNNETRPCHPQEQPNSNEFRLSHEMIVDIYETDDEGIMHNPIAKLTCMCVNAAVKGDVVACKDSDFREIIERVEHLGYPMNSLIIVHYTEVNEKNSLELIKQAFFRIQCILCKAATVEFNQGMDPGIYFDFKYMGSNEVKVLQLAIRDYLDGDMRIDKYDDGWYLHKIPWHPVNNEGN